MNELNFNVFNVIILFGVIHGLLFSLVLLVNTKLRSKTNNYLSFTVLALCFSNLQYLLYDFGVVGNFYAKYLFIPFEFLILPMFYFFVKSYLDKHLNKKLLYFFVLTFIIVFLIQSVVNVLNVDTNISNYLSLFFEYLSLSITLLLIVLTFKLIIDYERTNRFYKITLVKTTSWLKLLLSVGVFLCILWFFSLNILQTYFGDGLYVFYPLWIGISILLYCIAYTSILQTNIFNERKLIRKTINTDRVSYKTKEKQNIPIFQKAHQKVMGEKLFLNPKMSLSVLSKELDISEGYLSRLINQNLNKNFNE